MASEAPSASEVVDAMWRRDATAQGMGITVGEATLGAVTVEMTVTERHLGDSSQVHGGALFTLADVAMSYAGNTHNIYAVATGATINFVDTCHLGERLVAAATEHSLRGKAGIYDVTIRAQTDGRLVATFRGNTLRVGGSVIDLGET